MLHTSFSDGLLFIYFKLTLKIEYGWIKTYNIALKESINSSMIMFSVSLLSSCR